LIPLDEDAGASVGGYARPVRRTVFGVPQLDVALAAALLLVRLATLASGVQAAGGTASYLLAPVWTVPLAWRSRYPAPVAAAVAAASVTDALASGRHDSIAAFAAWMIAAYSLGAHARSRRGLLVGTVVLMAAGGWAAAERQPTNISALLGDLATVVVPLIAGLWVRAQRLQLQAVERGREERARSAVAEERTRIARELHDEIAHAMSVIALQADAAEGALAADPSLVRQPLIAIRDTARSALADLRRVLGGLRGDAPADLAPEPGLARVGVLVEQARAGGLHVDLRVEGDPVPLPPPLDLAAYRVLQEGLTNVRKHAAAGRVEILLRYGRDAVGVEITDDGDGSPGGGGTGSGLAGLRERVALLGGEFVAGPRSRGFALRVSLPLG
jgi:signal transduction histidine kinase